MGTARQSRRAWLVIKHLQASTTKYHYVAPNQKHIRLEILIATHRWPVTFEPVLPYLVEAPHLCCDKLTDAQLSDLSVCVWRGGRGLEMGYPLLLSISQMIPALNESSTVHENAAYDTTWETRAWEGLRA